MTETVDKNGVQQPHEQIDCDSGPEDGTGPGPGPGPGPETGAVPGPGLGAACKAEAEEGNGIVAEYGVVEIEAEPARMMPETLILGVADFGGGVVE